MFSQVAIENEIAGRVESRIGELLGNTAAAMAFARLCELPPVWKPARKSVAWKARHRLELAHRLLALKDSLALGEKERRGASRKAMAALPERLRELASVVSAVNGAPEGPVARLLGLAGKISRKNDTGAIVLSDRAGAFLHLPEMLRDYAGFLDGKRLTLATRAAFIPTLRSSQKVRLLDYVESWSGEPHYREVARLVLRVEGRPESALDTEIANLKRMKRGFRGQIPLPL